MSEPPRLITLTTDFGTRDTYVGTMKGVILGINPSAQIVDLTHDISSQDVHEAAFSIYTAHDYFPDGTIHVIVVDPGVGSERHAIVHQTDRAFFVCPDNGVLSYLLRGLQAAKVGQGHLIQTVAIQNRAYCLPEVSNTFHGRDVFAPVAAHLSLGVPLTDFGPRVQALVRLPLQEPEVSGNILTGQVIKIDTFGNAITNITARAFIGEMSVYEIRVGRVVLTRLNRAYVESGIGEPLAIIGSTGFLEIAINAGNAKAALGLELGDPVEIQGID